MVRLPPLARVLLGVTVGAALSGCFTTESVRKEPLQRLRTRALPADAVLHDEPAVEDATVGLFDGGVRFDPASRVRLRRSDASWTPWFDARHLHVGDDGLSVGARDVKWEELAFAEVRGPSPHMLEALRRTAPPGARVDATDLGARLEPGAASLRGWLAAALGATATDLIGVDLPGERRIDEDAGARWTLHSRVLGALPELDDAELRAALASNVRIADGLRWVDLDAAEVNNFDGGRTWVVVVAGTATLAAGSYAFSLLMPPSAAGVSAAEVRPDGARVVASPAFQPPRWSGQRRVFTDRALRVADVRWLVFGSFGSHLTELERVAPSAGAGARLRDVFELGLLVSPYWHAPRAPGGMLPGAPLSPGPDARVPVTYALAHAGLHLEVDARRRLALPLAVNAGLGPDGARQVRFRYGVRLRPVRGVWVGAYPFNPLFTRGWGWGFPSSIELLAEL